MSVPGWMDKFAQSCVIKGLEVMTFLDGLYEHAIMVIASSLFNLICGAQIFLISNSSNLIEF